MKPITLVRNKSYDPFLRLLHATLALSVVLLLASAGVAKYFDFGPERRGVWIFHIYVGQVLIAALALRVVWAFVGPHFSSWREFFRWLPNTKKERFGHDNNASLAYLILYGIMIGTAFTGLIGASQEFGLGPLGSLLFDDFNGADIIEDFHEFGSYCIIAFILIHIGAMIWHEAHDKVPIAQSMITGYQYREVENEKVE